MKRFWLPYFLLLGMGISLAQGMGDPWGFIDEATGVFRIELAPGEYKLERRAIGCPSGGTPSDFFGGCLNPFLRGFNHGDGNYSGESFRLDGLDRSATVLNLDFIFRSEADAENLLRSFLTWLKDFETLGKVGRVSISLRIPEGARSEVGICGIVGGSWIPPWLFPLLPFLPWLRVQSSPVEMKVYAYPKDGSFYEGYSAMGLAKVNTIEGRNLANLVAFAKGSSWKGLYGEPFTRKLVFSLERVYKRGAKPLCASNSSFGGGR